MEVISFLIVFVSKLVSFFYILIVARVLLSWARMGGMQIPNFLSEFIAFFTNPLFNFAHKFPLRIGVIDLTPLILLLGIDLLGSLVIALLTSLA